MDEKGHVELGRVGGCGLTIKTYEILNDRKKCEDTAPTSDQPVLVEECGIGALLCNEERPLLYVLGRHV
ncbi:rCG44145 [Rattus norvegicus]|uniref:RCG44145 n=1 Tax=Rattus norvegicus TaxID=10116 RepID=A6J7P9_RAT|nr:rCG44145 [Rattus norvegicus]